MTHDFSVDAKAHGVTGGKPLDTGLRVGPGDLLVITASPDDTWSAGPGDRTSNANGLGNPVGGNQYGIFTSAGHSFLYGSLVGTLDGGKTYFAVGTYLAMTVLAQGVLQLVYWDSFLGDNSGVVKATVQAFSGPRA